MSSDAVSSDAGSGEEQPGEEQPGETRSAGAQPAAGPSAGWALVASELWVLYRRLRTWAMLAALAAVPLLIAVVLRVTTEEPPPGRGPPFLDSITGNGLFVGLTALVVCTPLFLPLTVGVVAGDTIAGEASLGTLRYLLIAPAGRVRLLLVKYVGAAVFCVTATLAVVLSGTLIGVLLFPVGPVTLLSGDTISFGAALLRLLLIGAYVTVSLLGLSAIGLFISTMTDTPVGAMAATIVLAVTAQVLGAIPQLEWLHPWLFSHYWLGFSDLLREPILWDTFRDNTLLQLGYILVFGALAYGRFTTKDVLS